MELRIERYQSQIKEIWNQFVKNAKNSVFLFEREYMDYHADRFEDHSLLFYKEDELMAVLPANKKADILYSHGGLTYGGMILSKRAGVVFVLQAFEELINHLKANQFSSLIYKAVPYIYYKLPSQEDQYALSRFNAFLFRRDANCVIDLSEKIAYTKGTKSNLSKARKANLQVKESNDFALFMRIEEEILQKKYNTKPVHTAEEIRMLADRFPGNIRLFLIFKEDQCLGGAILFIMSQVVHTQYIGITDGGKETGALDFLIDYLLQEFCSGKRYFSFGISTEQEGKYLNEGLVRNKESFGARTIVNDFYKIDLV